MKSRKGKAANILSALAIMSLFIAPLFSILFEQERVEAIFGGLIIGAVIGSIFGIVAMLLNKGRSKLVIVLSIIPICVMGLFLLLAIPYYLFK